MSNVETIRPDDFSFLLVVKLEEEISRDYGVKISQSFNSSDTSHGRTNELWMIRREKFLLLTTLTSISFDTKLLFII